MASEKRSSPETIRSYGADLRHFATFMTDHFGALVSLNLLQDLTTKDFRSFMAALHMGRTGSGDGKRLDNSTRRRVLSAVKSFFRYLARNNGFDNLAIRHIRSPKLPTQIHKALPVARSEEHTSELQSLMRIS